tara:strand:- start:279 stop:425 length:147 start_codon:yes stop_codon:yes gene_type:complete
VVEAEEDVSGVLVALEDLDFQMVIASLVLQHILMLLQQLYQFQYKVIL